jgi:hypothetical protein
MPFKVIAWRELTGRFHIEVRQDDFTNEITVEVVKTTNGATVPTDEPLFLLRARDVLAAPLLLCYRALIEATHYPDPVAKKEHLYSNDKTRVAFEVFAHEHDDRMKLPNITRGK